MFRLLKLAALLLVLICSIAFANPNYYVNLGMSKPYAPDNFQKNWRSGYNIGAGIGYNFKPKLELQAEILYNNFPLDESAYLSDITDANDPFADAMGGTASIVSLYGNFKYLSPLVSNKTLTPYLIGGVGVASKIISEIDASTELDGQYTVAKETENALTGGVGLGVEIVMGARTSFVIEGRFNILMTDKTTVYFPLKLGIVIR